MWSSGFAIHLNRSLAVAAEIVQGFIAKTAQSFFLDVGIVERPQDPASLPLGHHGCEVADNDDDDCGPKEGGY